MIAKAGLGLIGLSAISIGGVAVAKPHWLGMDYMPSFHFLSEDQSSAGSDSNGKFGDKYKNYLVGVANNKNGQPNENKTNQAWWEWAYRRLSKDKDNSTSKKFKKEKHITGGFITSGNNAEKSLHKVCKDAYGTEDSNGFDTEGGSDVSKFKKSEVWKYCSPGLLTHTSKDKDKYTDQKIGGKTDNKDLLISVEDSSNDWFWNQRNKDFWATTGDWSGNGAAAGGDENNKSIFKTEYDAKKEGSDKTTIKELCKRAYEKGHGDSTNNEKDAKKFCVLEVAATQ